MPAHGPRPEVLPLGLRESLDFSPDLVFVAGEDGRLLWINHAHDELTGRDRAERVGEPFPHLFTGKARSAAIRYVTQKHERSILNLKSAGIAGVQHEFGATRHHGPAGAKSRREPRLAVRVRWIEGAERSGLFLGVARAEGADRESLRARLNEVAARVIEARVGARVRTEFLESMTDEVSAPMDGVMSMVQLLLNTPLGDEQRRLVEVIHSSCQALLNLMNDALEFSYLESGQVEIARREFDLRLAIEEVERLLGPIAREKGLTFECHVNHDVPSRLQGDPGRMRQVLLNFAGTAIRQSGKGKVAVQVSRSDEDDLGVQLHFSVSHPIAQGSEVEIVELVEAFLQSDAAPVRLLGGASLAYAIARRMTELMGGEVGAKVADDLSECTTWFQLQFDKPDARLEVGVVGVGESKTPKLAGLEVMIVDSSPTSRRSLTESLTEWGCVPHEADTSAMALIKLRKAAALGKPVRVVLVDKELADGGTFELAKVVGSDPALEDALLLLLAGTGQRGDAAIAEQAGFSAYLVKPIESAVLIDALVAVLSARSRGPRTLVTRHSLAEARRGGVRVLLVEDNPVDQLVSQWALERLGWRVELIGTAAAARDAFTRGGFSLILMDVQLPDGNGADLAAELRERELAQGTARVPIVAITVDADPATRERCLASGMDDLLAKPVDLEGLCRMVGKWLEASAGSRGAESRPQVAERARDDSPSIVDLDLSAANLDDIESVTPPPPAPPGRPVEPGPAPRPLKLGSSGAAPQDASGDEDDIEAPGDPMREILPTLDLVRLEEMCMGVGSMRTALLDTFIAEIGPRLERLVDAVRDQDPEQIQVVAHGLRGMLGTIGASAGAELFGALETIAQAGDLETVEALMRRAVREAERARTAIEQLPDRRAA